MSNPDDQVRAPTLRHRGDAARILFAGRTGALGPSGESS